MPKIFNGLIAILALLSATPALAIDVNFQGYLKSYLIAQEQQSNSFYNLPSQINSQNNLRLMLDVFSQQAVWQIHYEISPQLSSRDSNAFAMTSEPSMPGYRLTDLDPLLATSGAKQSVLQNLDRFNVQFQFADGDLTIGRQAITFGSARMINPTDVFLPFSLGTLNTEYRIGVDAVRYQKAWGELGEIDIGLVSGDGAQSENSAAFVQAKQNLNGKDLNFSLIRFADQTLVGGGLETALGEFGFWLEIASVSGLSNYQRGSVGLDYAFTANTFAMIEYHVSTAGTKDTDQYLNHFESLSFTTGGVFLLGEHYIIASLAQTFSPLWQASAQTIINLDDDSSFTMLSTNYNIAEDFYLDFGVYLFNGKGLKINDNLGQVLLGSEYGASPNSAFVSIRFYF
ncbi:MAG: hypothetical protein HOL98_01320 [Gammaproteobacteria bacterium]|nr:hypothetical protein [Gammaproteobacteria bacterium]MBT5202069.1 hypothetical protein [Gammaproteobacteria bacterium]MBT5603039.1 hypothetical protein [Gammaproteobacteria bacterium]MBT6245557.1 hypothetical protein [Gammaproteobacteria bacterium]